MTTDDKPLTPLMLAVLHHLADRQDRVLVRHFSNYWIAEVDQKCEPLHREMRDLNGKLLASGLTFAIASQPLLAIRTSTVTAMANRGLLKLLGPKRIVIAAGRSKDYARAILTPQATQVRESIEDKSLVAYEGVLNRLR